MLLGAALGFIFAITGSQFGDRQGRSKDLQEPIPLPWKWVAPPPGVFDLEIKHWRAALSDKRFVFCWSSGHTGSTTLGKSAFSSSDTYSANEVYVPDMKTALPLLKAAYATQNSTLLWRYMLSKKLPHQQHKAGGKRNIFEFGHNVIFGELAVMLLLFPTQIKVVRLRRNHCEVATSFMFNPPVCPMYRHDMRELCVQFCPGDKGSILRPSETLWWSNVVRVWWFIDEVEMQWQALTAAYPAFPSIEVYWDKADPSSYNAMVATIAQFISNVSIFQHIGNLQHHAAADSKKKKVMSAGTRKRMAFVHKLSRTYLKGTPVLDSSAKDVEVCETLAESRFRFT